MTATNHRIPLDKYGKGMKPKKINGKGTLQILQFRKSEQQLI